MKTLKLNLLSIAFIVAFTFPSKTFSQTGAGLNFDGTNDQVNIPNVASLNISGNITLEAWVYATKNTGVQNTMCKSSNTQNTGYIFPRTDNGWTNFVVYLHIGGTWRTLSAPFGTLNTWIHLAATWDGTNIRLYRNGALVATSPNYTGALTLNTNQLTIGSQPGYSEVFGGRLDECRIWSVARSQCQINTFMNCEIPTTATNLVANYHFNQGVASANNATVTSLADASGNANNGTLANFALNGATSNWIAPTAVVSGSNTPLAAPNVSFTATNPVICNSGTTSLSGSGASTYTWAGGITNGTAFSPTITSNYTVTGTNALTTCTNNAIATISVGPTPVITVNSGSICSGSNFTILPSGASTYTFSSGSAIVSPTTNTNYTVTGTSAIGCVNSTGVVSSVTVIAKPTVGATSTSSFVCPGNNVTLNGTGASSYTWTSGVTNGVAFSPTVSGTYTVIGTAATSCTNVASISVSVGVTPIISVNSGAICTGNSFTMTPGGASTYTYSGGSAVVSPTATTSYSVDGTDANGCVSAASAVSNVTVNALPVISVNSGAICTGNSFTMTPGGASTYTYSGGSAVVSPTATTSYSVDGTDANGCVSAASAVSNVTVNALPVISVNSGAICTGNSFTMTPGGASTYTYSGGSAVVSPTATTSYSVDGTDANGCVSAASAVSNVTVNALPVISVNSGAICTGNSFTMTPGGASTYTYSGGSAVVSPTATTSYSVDGTDANGCVSAAPAVSNVTVNTLPTVSAITSTSLLCVGQTASLTASGANTYTWNTSATTVVIAISPTVTTSYTVTGTDGNGCDNSSVITQSVSACTGISQLVINSGAVVIYPNPFNSKINIQSNGSGQEAIVYNALGSIVQSAKLENEKTEIDLSNQSSGVYFVRIGNDTKKLIKE